MNLTAYILIISHNRFIPIHCRSVGRIYPRWREHGAGSPQAKKKRAEARAQRHHGNLRIISMPPPPGSIFVCQSYFGNIRTPISVVSGQHNGTSGHCTGIIRTLNNLTDFLPDLSRQRRSRRVRICREPPPEQPKASDSAIYVDPQGAQ